MTEAELAEWVAADGSIQIINALIAAANPQNDDEED